MKGESRTTLSDRLSIDYSARYVHGISRCITRFIRCETTDLFTKSVAVEPRCTSTGQSIIDRGKIVVCPNSSTWIEISQSYIKVGPRTHRS